MAKKEIGKKMYLFTKTANTYADNLVISAHGGIDQKKQPRFNIRSGTLHFYSVHGEVTKDYGIRNFIFGGKANQLVESLHTGDLCYDYSLSKYQGRHAGTANKPAETYDSISEAQDYVDIFNDLVRNAGDNAPRGVQAATDFDVLTIRNLWWNSDVKLSTALSAVNKYNYANIHCYFCRSFIPDQ